MGRNYCCYQNLTFIEPKEEQCTKKDKNSIKYFAVWEGEQYQIINFYKYQFKERSSSSNALKVWVIKQYVIPNCKDQVKDYRRRIDTIMRRVLQFVMNTYQQSCTFITILGVSFCLTKNAFNFLSKSQNKNVRAQFSKSSIPLLNLF